MKKNIYIVARLGILSVLLSACGVRSEGGFITEPGIYKYGSGPERTAFVYKVEVPFHESTIAAAPLDSDKDCTFFDIEEYAMLVCQQLVSINQ